MAMSQTEQQSRLKITEIFHSLQGEARNVGLPTVFVRLTDVLYVAHIVTQRMPLLAATGWI